MLAVVGVAVASGEAVGAGVVVAEGVAVGFVVGVGVEVGVVLLGNFNVIKPPAQAWQTLRSLIANMHDDYHIDYVAGHHDFQPEDTECPGAHLAARLPVLAADLQMKFGTGGYVVPKWIK